MQNKPHLVEPIDFENFVLKNKTLLQNDPQRELLLYPQDDISVSFHFCTAYLQNVKPNLKYEFRTQNKQSFPLEVYSQILCSRD